MSDPESPGAAYWALVGPIWNKISIYEGPEVFLRQFRAVREVEGNLFAAHWCQSEVCNGGFHQFFCNATGVLAPEALHAFSAMGLAEWAHTLNEAMQYFGKQYPRDRELRIAQLAPPLTRWVAFESLDERFYAWLHEEPYFRWEYAADRYALAGGSP